MFHLTQEYSFKRSHLTGDHQYLTISGENGHMVYILKFQSHKKYLPIYSYIVSGKTNYASMSEDKKWFTLSQQYQLLIYEYSDADGLKFYDRI